MSKVTRSYLIQHRRRRQGKTNYKLRLALVKSGKSRAVIRRSASNMRVQFVNFNEKGDLIVSNATTMELKKYGWKAGNGNIPAAYLTGLLAGTRAKNSKIEEAILDMGTQINTKGSRIYAALAGIVASGVNIPHSKEVLPSEERISGKHISEWSAKSKGFTKYGIKPEEFQSHFEEVKKMIIESKGAKK